MERRITKKIETHGQSFKNAIKDWFTENGNNVIDDDGESITGKFLAFVYDFENLHLEKEDFQKRKRVKNTVPEFERCTARRGQQTQFFYFPTTHFCRSSMLAQAPKWVCPGLQMMNKTLPAMKPNSSPIIAKIKSV